MVDRYGHVRGGLLAIVGWWSFTTQYFLRLGVEWEAGVLSMDLRVAESDVTIRASGLSQLSVVWAPPARRADRSTGSMWADGSPLSTELNSSSPSIVTFFAEGAKMSSTPDPGAEGRDSGR